MSEVSVPAGSLELAGSLDVPEGTRGVVVFAHGSGSSRLSPRNRMVAETLHRAGLATLLFDLLTPDEADRRQNVFDIELLAGRLSAATDWLCERQGDALPVGYFGASTGAAAALVAAAGRDDVRAVVSRGGRPDLAGPAALERVGAATLLIVGGNDPVVLEMNQLARTRLGGESDLVVIPGATHLFEEAGALEQVARLASDWFVSGLFHELEGG